MELQESIDRFRGPLTGLFIAWGVPAADAIELAQDSLADAYLSRASCRGNVSDLSTFGKWLRGIAKNKFRNWLRSRSRRKRLAGTIPMGDWTQVAVEHRDDDERLIRLRIEIERLPAKYRQVVIMHYLDETSVVDVAALLAITPKAVEGRLYQARKRLRTRMEADSSLSQVAKALLL